GAKPFMMTQATWGMAYQPCTQPGTPQNLTATGGNRRVSLSWMPGNPAPAGGYNIYYDQAGKKLYRASVPAGTTTYTDTGLRGRTTYCYSVTAWNDCNGNGIYDPGIDMESAHSNVACATTK
ncbi:MAG: fibronectin type III domain-containing protein, partial [Thermodesulfovibrionales bacterium]|nr:fibronectin type III domain-containing protein [Thermodesulfovibrionales bacterium]